MPPATNNVSAIPDAARFANFDALQPLIGIDLPMVTTIIAAPIRDCD